MAKEKNIVGFMNIIYDNEKHSMNNKVYHMKKLLNLRMGEGVSIATHLDRLNMIINQLTYVKVDYVDEVRALIILASLY